MGVRLRDLISGVVAVSAPNGFPRETMPAQGTVEVEFASGGRMKMTANEHEFEGAQSALKKGSASSPKAFKYLLQVAHNVNVSEETAAAIIAAAKML